MASLYEMLRETVMRGLQRANFNLDRVGYLQVRSGLFSDQLDVQMAQSSANSMITRLKMQAARGELPSREAIEGAIDLMAAESAYNSAVSRIRIYMISGSNVSKYVRDARNALAVMERYPDSGVRMYQKLFKELIGEE